MDVEVVIVGGGIQGVGLLHDLATRRMGGIQLFEESSFASGTSSRSTKLVHGGLRYLERLSQWGLVHEALSERATLLRVLKGIVRPVPFVLPGFKGGRPPWMLRAGLFLYDILGGDSGLPRSRALTREGLREVAPYLLASRVARDFECAFLFYDAQMLDDVIVRLAAAAAQKLGARATENARVTKVERRSDGGFRVVVRTPAGEDELTSRIVVNASGAWANANLLRWGIAPRVSTLLNVGSHLVFKPEVVPHADPSQTAATLLQNDDGRVVFFIPWNGRWLFGTTESVHAQMDPRGTTPPLADVEYLLKAADMSLSLHQPRAHIEEAFCGVRTMPLAVRPADDIRARADTWADDPFASPFYVHKAHVNISALSRESVIDEPLPGLHVVYGGKYTTYRAQAEKLGARIGRSLGRGGQSATQVSESWFLTELLRERPEIFSSLPHVRQL